MASKIIDITAGFKTKSRFAKSGKETRRVAFVVKGGDFKVNTDERQFMEPVGDAIADVFRKSLLRGFDPTGKRMPGIKSSTDHQREVEQAQGRRGGEPHPRYFPKAKQDKKGRFRPANDTAARRKFRSDVKRNYDKRYRASKKLKELAGPFAPQNIKNGTRGLLSGMLANSFSARVTKDGDGFVIFAAGPRINIRDGDNESAFERVYKGARMWNKKANDQKTVRAALDQAIANTNESRRRKIISGIAQAFKRVERITKSVDDIE